MLSIALEMLATTGLFIACSIITIISLLYLREYRLRKKAENRNLLIDQEVQKKSFELLDAAQIAETKILSESGATAMQMEEQVKAKLDEFFNSSSQTANNAQKQLFDFLGELKNTAVQSQLESQRSVEARINEMFERLETRLSNFLIKTEQSTTSSIELELRSARNLIESYKTQQLALIDENIMAMMEQTLNIVLSKKLSLKDQLDLIYEALEKAKVEKFLT